MSWNSIWKKYIIFERKQINLHGPDDNNYYQHDLRQESHEFYSRQMGGGSVMVWGTFSYVGKCDRQRVDGYTLGHI